MWLKAKAHLDISNSLTVAVGLQKVCQDWFIRFKLSLAWDVVRLKMCRHVHVVRCNSLMHALSFSAFQDKTTTALAKVSFHMPVPRKSKAVWHKQWSALATFYRVMLALEYT